VSRFAVGHIIGYAASDEAEKLGWKKMTKARKDKNYILQSLKDSAIRPWIAQVRRDAMRIWG
jgi:hypothetical protein